MRLSCCTCSTKAKYSATATFAILALVFAVIATLTPHTTSFEEQEGDPAHRKADGTMPTTTFEDKYFYTKTMRCVNGHCYATTLELFRPGGCEAYKRSSKVALAAAIIGGVCISASLVLTLLLVIFLKRARFAKIVIIVCGVAVVALVVATIMAFILRTHVKCNGQTLDELKKGAASTGLSPIFLLLSAIFALVSLVLGVSIDDSDLYRVSFKVKDPS